VQRAPDDAADEPSTGATRRHGVGKEMSQLWHDAFMEMSDLLEEVANQLSCQDSGVVTLHRDLK
jgi:hypothetical protein